MFKDLLQKKETTKIISIQNQEQGNHDKNEPCKEIPNLVENPVFDPEFRSSPPKKSRKILKEAKRDFGPNQPLRQNGKPYSVVSIISKQDIISEQGGAKNSSST